MHQNRDLTNDKYGQMAENWFTIPQNSLTLRVANSWRELELEVSNVLPGKIVILVMLWLSYYGEFLLPIVVRMYLIFSNHGLDELDLRAAEMGILFPSTMTLCFKVWWVEQQKWGLKQLDVVILYGSKKTVLFQRAQMWIFNIAIMNGVVQTYVHHRDHIADWLSNGSSCEFSR